jgi:hypothetical protein
MMGRVNGLVFLSLLTSTSGLAAQPMKRLSVIEDDRPTSRYAHECWMKRPVKLAAGVAALLQEEKDALKMQNASNASADAKDAPDVKPFETVLKDGFLGIDCVKDYQYNHGFPNIMGSAIVHYDETVAKEDQKQMTPKVCFEFCRTVPKMNFFGIVNGRKCYCAPYYKAMAGDSSNCDAVCPGQPTLMCGGKSKSQIFEMHMCNSAEEDLAFSAERASDLAAKMDKKASNANALSNEMQLAGADLQKTFGAVGDVAAADLMQKAKVFAGFLQHAAHYVDVMSSSIASLVDESKSFAGSVPESERLTAKLDKARVQSNKLVEKLDSLMEDSTYPDAYDGAAKQYYPLMYFVDKSFVGAPSTCAGKLVGPPKGKTSLDGCAQACDEQVHSCVGFSYFAKSQLCFLMAKFTAASYYTGCKSNDGKLAFLQQAPQADVTCMAKFSKFEGTTLKPDASGKCKQCLKKITKADRCYTAAEGTNDAPPEKIAEKVAPPKRDHGRGNGTREEKTFEETTDKEITEEVMEDGEIMDEDWESMWDDFDEGNNHEGDYDDEWDELNLRARKAH